VDARDCQKYSWKKKILMSLTTKNKVEQNPQNTKNKKNWQKGKDPPPSSILKKKRLVGSGEQSDSTSSSKRKLVTKPWGSTSNKPKKKPRGAMTENHLYKGK